MELPILRVNNVLVFSLPTDLYDDEVLEFQRKLLEAIRSQQSPGVVIDLSSVEIMDSFMCRVLNEIAQMTWLMGARVVISGIQPAVAISLIELGIDLGKIPTLASLDQGLAYLLGKAISELS